MVLLMMVLEGRCTLILDEEEGGDQPVLEVFVKPRSLLSLGRPILNP